MLGDHLGYHLGDRPFGSCPQERVNWPNWIMLKTTTTTKNGPDVNHKACESKEMQRSGLVLEGLGKALNVDKAGASEHN